MKYTDTAPKLFMNTGTRFPRRIIWAMGLIKYACARVNMNLGLLDREIGRAIIQAAEQVMKGDHDDKIILDVFQTGSGTGLNMNINEVIAETASKIANKHVHPNDHVNLGQSSNDTVPTGIRVAAAAEVEENLIPALTKLINTLDRKAEEYKDIVKAGRTHLRDALPVTLGQELSAYSDAFKHDLENIRQTVEYVKELPIGGTAVGTGANSHPDFQIKVIDEINNETGLGFKPANKFRAMRLLTDLLTLSGALRTSAVNLYRLGQDIRLMFSGPMTGFNEIDLPSQEEIAGSSIMPGKTNPVTVEASLLISAQVVGLDHANQFASMLGEFELSMGIPLIGYNVVTQTRLLAEALNKFADLVIDKMVPNLERMRRLAESSPSLITIVSPVIGYDKASEIGKKLAKGLSIREALKELGYNDEQIDKILDLKKLTKPGFSAK
ncbi:class II fumarate hydratase [Sulfolobus acidocaldarius]|uniref:fumarate hydratase n=4 Tax=Sulfolobus acidocaldarius TaxID=2285 RepID=Q4JCD3_SULAC|nr:fumarate hydratase class II [Sulfolobus acidocaldarius DSM 639]AGE70097.1 fumarate hydratase [Sulfolobus acidocaldarius N8]AGE72372.1 fumarate hydratase [Sulfolobus acidocaldarius Ron12/I]ALU29484.1 fumarate hydratase [Sulfolobus acidocaldarius]ALU32212.1 fumarate hydratase [Sulfolobus acidocaldarius]